MIEIKFSFASFNEAYAFIKQHVTIGDAAVVTEVPGKPDPKPVKDEKPVKPAAKPEASAPAPAPTPAASTPSAAPAPTAAPAPAAEPVTYEKSGLAVKISQAAQKDKAAVVALLAEFGVAKGPMLKPDQFAAFGVKIDALLAGGDLA